MRDNFILPLSIVFAGLIIGAGFYFGDFRNNSPSANKPESLASKDLLSIMRPIDDNDHILGDSNARVIIIEYSDPECPFCKIFHSTMENLMNEYGKTGKVAWVYRHYPILELHPNSFKKAEALECVANIAGNEKFWQFASAMYEANTEEKAIPFESIYPILKSLNISESSFKSCINSGEFTPRVQNDVNNAKEMEILGTPYSLLIDRKTGDYYPIEGAYPYYQLKQAVDIILSS